MDERPWAEEIQKDKAESLRRDKDENLEIEEENLQTDWERAENRKAVKRVFGRVALGLSAMIIAFFFLWKFWHLLCWVPYLVEKVTSMLPFCFQH